MCYTIYRHNGDGIMNKKGFTLIELLAVIIVLAVLVLITTISTGTTIQNSKNSLSEIQIQKIEEAAKIYYLKEGMNLTDYDNNNIGCVDVGYLIDNGYFDNSIITNPNDDSSMLGSVKIMYESNNYRYQYQDEVCSVSEE